MEAQAFTDLEVNILHSSLSEMVDEVVAVKSARAEKKKAEKDETEAEAAKKEAEEEPVKDGQCRAITLNLGSAYAHK